MKVKMPIHRIVGYKEEEIGVMCPWCASGNMEFCEPEMLRCNQCNHQTDFYEAMKLYEKIKEGK